MMLDNYIVHLEPVISSFFLWAGLYILSRSFQAKNSFKGWWHRPIVTVGLSLILASFFYFGAAVHFFILSIPDYLFWGKLTWWASSFSITFWFITIYNVYFQGQTESKTGLRIKRAVFILAFTYAFVIAIVGTFTDLIFNYSQIQTLIASNGMHHLHVPPGRLFYLYSFQDPILLWISVWLLSSRLTTMSWKDSRHRVYQTILLGSGFFATGSSLSAIGYFGVYWQGVDTAGTMLIFFGFLILMRGFFLHNLWMGNRILQIDMMHSFITVVVISTIYLTGLTLLQSTTLANSFSHPGLFTGILYLTTLLHTPSRVNQTLTDRILPSSLFPSWEKRYIEQMARLKQAIITATAPDAAVAIVGVIRDAQEGELGGMIENEIDQIFRHKSIENNEFLAQSRLLELRILKKEIEGFQNTNGISKDDLTPPQIAQVLRLFLNEQIQKLSSEIQDLPSSKPTNEWIEIVILNQRYVLGKQQSQVEAFLEQMGVVATGGAYARHLQNGRKRLAAQILQSEIALKQENAKSG